MICENAYALFYVPVVVLGNFAVLNVSFLLILCTSGSLEYQRAYFNATTSNLILYNLVFIKRIEKQQQVDTSHVELSKIFDKVQHSSK